MSLNGRAFASRLIFLLLLLLTSTLYGSGPVEATAAEDPFPRESAPDLNRLSALQSSGDGVPTGTRISVENALPGTDEWADIGWYDPDNLSAFPGAVSVNAGNPINIHVRSSGTSLSWRLYRLGYYQDHGARLITTGSGVPTSPQPDCTREAATGLVQCPWSATFAVDTQPTWVSGIYLLRMDSNFGSGRRYFVYFVVRNDSYKADILAMEPTKTNQSYNRYGGESLYYSANNEGRIRAYKVSFDRPYIGGGGTGGLFIRDIEMVRWLEASGYDLKYISDVDREANPGVLLDASVKPKVFIEIGHDEYWTWEERDTMEAAVAQGVNMVFPSGNESFWRIRMEDSSVGANRIIVGYKDSQLDPVTTPSEETLTFRELGRPENSLVGNAYQGAADDVLYSAPWVLYGKPDRWYYDCTGFQEGDQVNNIVGDEWNARLDNGYTPEGLEVLSQGTVIDSKGDARLQETTIYTATGGAKVFAAGTFDWAYGLIDHTYPNQKFQPSTVSQDADHRIQQLTANIIDNFAGYWDGQPRACGPANQNFYDIDVVNPRPTRTAQPQAPTATSEGGSQATSTRTGTATRTSTATPTGTPVQGAACTLNYSSADVPKDIPDPGTVTSSLQVPYQGTIGAVEVTGIRLQHTYPGDVRLYLVSPQGTRVDLFSFVCGGADWTIDNTGFTLSDAGGSRMGEVCPPNTGTYKLEGGTLSILAGQPSQGSWSLEAMDAGASDTGSLQGWGLRITLSSNCPVATATSTSTPTSSATATSTATSISTSTRTATMTATATRTATRTATSTATHTATVTASSTSTQTSTQTPLPSATATPTPTSMLPSTSTSTSTPSPTMTSTSTAPAGVTDTVTPTSTQTAIAAASSTSTAQATCTLSFVDVPQGSTFYDYVQWMACQGHISGYACGGEGEACPGNYFRPGANVTRGQMLKMLVNAAGWSQAAPESPTFADVPAGSPFHIYIETAAARSIISGYPCGQINAEPCDSANRPYFRPGSDITRGQIAKVVALARSYESAGGGTSTFADVPAGSPFYPYIEAIASRSIVSGYPCGQTLLEPCDASSRPYFRPGYSVTRGQVSKIVAGAFSNP